MKDNVSLDPNTYARCAIGATPVNAILTKNVIRNFCNGFQNKINRTPKEYLENTDFVCSIIKPVREGENATASSH